MTSFSAKDPANGLDLKPTDFAFQNLTVVDGSSYFLTVMAPTPGAFAKTSPAERVRRRRLIVGRARGGASTGATSYAATAWTRLATTPATAGGLERPCDRRPSAWCWDDLLLAGSGADRG